jgi:hypothetical protein
MFYYITYIYRLMPSREQQDIHWIPGLLLVVFLRPQVLENRLDLSKGGVGTPVDLWNRVESCGA